MSRFLIVAFAASAVAVVTATEAKADDWSGFHVGVDAGLAMPRLRATASDLHFQLTNVVVPGRGIIVVPGTAVPLDESDRGSELVYGGFAGAQWQTGGLIIGFEGDVSGPRDLSSVSSTVSIPATALAPTSSATLSREAESRWEYSARARIGADLGRSMIYATGGIAGARVRLRGVDAFTTPAGPAAPPPAGGVTFVSPAIGPVVTTVTERSTMTGWTAGIGGERRLSRLLGIGLEARYTDYGSKTFPLDCGLFTLVDGDCGSLTAPPVIINGNTLVYGVDTPPFTDPGPTRISLNEWRIVARVILRFGSGE